MALTKHPSGSVREMCAIAFPLMITSLSMMLMLFVDRLLIAQYSPEALNALVNATTLGWAFGYTGLVLAGISEVFVAQHNGAGRKDKLGEPVWQMLWFALMTSAIFIPLAYFGGDYIYGSERPMERIYFSWMMFFAPTYAMYAALTGFFVGQGKTFLVTTLAIVANLFNAILDYFLIFGIEGWIPAMGIEGAAIATCGSSLFQALVLFIIFLNEKNRKESNTGRYQFVWSEFCRCLRFGTPAAVFVAVEILAWASYYQMMTQLSDNHIMVAGICQTIALIFFFVVEGINKAASTIAGNLIGANKRQDVHNVIKSGVIVLSAIYLVLFIICAGGRELVFTMFMPHASPEEVQLIYYTMMFALGTIMCSMFFEGIRMLYAGVLTAAGDTNFLMWIGSLSIWVMMLLPIYLFVVKTGGTIEQAISIVGLYHVLASGIYALRFYAGQWKSIRIRAEA
jgi:MATE family multidrug resistance protein